MAELTSTSRRLSELTTLRVGGPAARLVEAHSEADLIWQVQAADAVHEPVLLVAGGSNLLVSDEGFPGLVVCIRTSGREVVADPADPTAVFVTAAAGERWDDFVTWTVAQGFAGLEALSGIPGSAGATPIQNVGAYGADVAQVIQEIRVYDRRTCAVEVLPAATGAFSYRDSVFKRQPGRWLVLSVTFRLMRGALSAPVRYAELARALQVSVGESAPAPQVREAVLRLRRSKGMVLDSADHDTWSAGSFFTNPILSADQAALLPDGAPRFAGPDGQVKTSAAWLISNAGFARGYRLNPEAQAALSSKHSLALTNRGGASAADLLELARAVRAGVKSQFGITLEPEPVFVGCAL